MAVNHAKVRELLMASDRLTEARYYNGLLDVAKVAKDVDAFYQGQSKAGQPELVAIPTSLLVGLHEALSKLKG